MRGLGSALRYTFREAATNVLRSRAVTFLTIGIIAASLFILGGFVLLVSNLHAAIATWNRVSINVYLHDDVPAETVQALRARIEADPVVAEVRHVTREEAALIFRERFAHLASAADALGGNPFPASLEIVARGGRDERLDATQALIEALRADAAVEEVRDNEADARKVLSLVRLVAAGGWVVGGILSAASLFTIFNVIRLAVYQRRDEIAIMRLVGATSSFIRGPFVAEGMLQGVLGAAAAMGTLWLAHGRLQQYAAATENPFLRLIASGFLSAPQAGGLILAGTLLGMIGSLLSLRRFLTEERVS